MNTATPLRVGPAKYSNGGTIEFHRYHNGEIVIDVIADDGQREARATVALEFATNAASRNGVWLKGWSENEGLPEALEKAGIVKRTGEKHATGFCEAEFAELLVPAEVAS